MLDQVNEDVTSATGHLSSLFKRACESSFRRHQSVTLNLAKLKFTVNNCPYICVWCFVCELEIHGKHYINIWKHWNWCWASPGLSRSLFYMEFFATDLLSTCNTFLSWTSVKRSFDIQSPYKNCKFLWLCPSVKMDSWSVISIRNRTYIDSLGLSCKIFVSL